MTIGAYFEPTVVRLFPDAVVPSPGACYLDDFRRTSIQPTNATQLYVATNNGGGTGTIDTTYRLALVTSAGGAGEDVDVRLAGYAFRHTLALPNSGTVRSYPNINGVEINTSFALNEATDTEGFVGLTFAGTQMSALPTTARHLGVYWDISAGANFVISSANGTAQVTNDSGRAVDTATYILQIIWTGADTATINLRDSAGVLIDTSAVTAYEAGTAAPSIIHWFVQTEAVAAKTLRAFNWSARFL